MAAVEFARPPSRPFLRSTLDISLTARSVSFNTFRKDVSGGCRVCSTPISSFSSVHSRHPTNGAFNHVQRLSRGWEWRLSSLLNPRLVLLRSTLDISPTVRSSCSTPFERTGVVAVEFARPPSRPFLRSTFDISPTARSVMFNTFRKDESGGCRVCSTPISSFSSVRSRHPTNGAFNHVQHLSRGREWRLLSLLDPRLVLLRSTLDISPTARSSCSTSFERTGVAAVEFA